MYASSPYSNGFLNRRNGNYRNILSNMSTISTSICIIPLWTLIEKKVEKEKIMYHSGWDMNNTGILEFKRVFESRILLTRKSKTCGSKVAER